MVQPMTYIFDEEPARWRRLVEALGLNESQLMDALGLNESQRKEAAYLEGDAGAGLIRGQRTGSK